MNELLQRIRGLDVVIVGNAPTVIDHSPLVDSADLVIRFNHFYNIDSGKVGRKTDIVVQTFCDVWESAVNKHVDVLKEFDSTIFIGKKPHQYTPSVHRYIGADRKVVNLARLFFPFGMYTTGGAFICYISSVLEELKGTRIRVIGFGLEDERIWEEYIKGDASRYSVIAEEERRAVKDAVSRIHSFSEMQHPTGAVEIPTRIVVPLKRNSTGCPGKNRILVPHLLGKLKDAGMSDMVSVVGDDPELIAMAKNEYDMDAMLCDDIMEFGNVNDTLRLWKSKNGYCGNMMLVQATTPGLKTQWIDETRSQLKRHSLVATACEFTGKFTSLYAMDSGIYRQLGCDFARTDVPRQELPKCVRLNGGVFGFHSDALDFKSFYECGFMHPIIVDEKDSVDVDTLDDMTIAMRMI